VLHLLGSELLEVLGEQVVQVLGEMGDEFPAMLSNCFLVEKEDE